MNIKDKYVNHIDTLSDAITRLKHRNRFFVAGEITAFLGIIGFVVLYTTIVESVYMLVLSAVSLVAYAVIRTLDVKNSDTIELLENKRQVYRNELNYLKGDFTCFDEGADLQDPHHAFAFDLDIFGRDSLFNRINRTVTSGGREYLAKCLSTQHHCGDTTTKSFVEARRKAVDLLAEKEDVRAAFMAVGQQGRIDTAAVQKALEEVKSVCISRYFGSPLLLVVAIVAIITLISLIALSIFTSLEPSISIQWAILQFFIVFMLCSAPLRRIHKAINKLTGQLKAYTKLISIITSVDMGDDADSALSGALTIRRTDALNAFAKLDSVLAGLDRRGNMLGIVLFDTFILSDFFLVRQFLGWRNRYIDIVTQCIDDVSIIDALVSMATFRYNEPAATCAEIVSDEAVVYEARGLYHPFLGAKAVRNDFSICDGNYYIITGANMAGKSTFLRSVGVNYILAMCGMPVFADSLKVSVYSLFSSMRTTDDLTHGISYFNAELLRLKQLISECSQQKRTLIILDEILKGTNSLDKLNGSKLFLESISQLPVSGIIATHDLELSKMSDEKPDRFHNCCFEIELGTDVTYTYKITPGVAQNQNATFLLKGILKNM